MVVFTIVESVKGCQRNKSKITKQLAIYQEINEKDFQGLPGALSMLPDIQPSRLTPLKFNMAGYPKNHFGRYLSENSKGQKAYIAHLSFSYALWKFFAKITKGDESKPEFYQGIVGCTPPNVPISLYKAYI